MDVIDIYFSMQFWTISIDYTNDSFQMFIQKIADPNNSYQMLTIHMNWFFLLVFSNKFPFLESLLEFFVKHEVDHDNGQQSDNGKTDHFDAHEFREAFS